jgi:lipoprotein-releasing system ATP-binding protein
MLKAQQIFKSYGQLPVLKGIDLEIKSKEIVSIVGASGAGKSTLLHILGTLDEPDQGKVLLDGIDLTRLKARALASLRNEKIGFIFQFHNLLPEFSAIENVCFPAYIRGAKNSEKDAKQLLERLGLSERMHHKPSELSGGEQQRGVVARS